MKASKQARLLLTFLAIIVAVGYVSVWPSSQASATAQTSVTANTPAESMHEHSVHPVSSVDDLVGARIYIAGRSEELTIETLVWGITSEDLIGYAVLIGHYDDGTVLEEVNLEAFERLARSPKELLGGVWAVEGSESVYLDGLELGVDQDRTIRVLRMEGRDVSSAKQLAFRGFSGAPASAEVAS